MLQWLQTYANTLWWLWALSIVMFVGSLIAVPILVARIPADYFRRDYHPTPPAHPALRLVLRILRNLFGLIFIGAGLAMLVLPGQGIITILIGLMLTDFTGKRTLERRIVQQPSVRKAINWMRARAHQPPLEVAEPAAEPEEQKPSR